VTKWTEFPLRKPGEYWPGLSTRNGRLMRRIGELADCVNINIQPFDTMSKRKGIVRAFDERFSGVVCGLFAYTDNCGNEYMLIADQSGFSIRSPSVLPSFTIADCYPFDSFATAGAMNPVKWRNAARYVAASDVMEIAAGAGVVSESVLQDSLAACARWFKDACSSSYQTKVTFSFDPAAAPRQRLVQVIRGVGDLSGFASIVAILELKVGVDYTLRLLYRSAQGVFKELARRSFDVAVDATDGTLQLAYNASTRVPSASIALGTAAAVDLTPTALLSVEDANLGLVSALGLMQVEAGARPALSVAVIDGGPV
jgi:hypothetical protein